ncbi:hypothetical protein OG21DRAFT_1604785 [Imleria badia]|nr:hypothetical protein OG21DRAFT_1604785 [Imleria badia]
MSSRSQSSEWIHAMRSGDILVKRPGSWKMSVCITTEFHIHRRERETETEGGEPKRDAWARTCRRCNPSRNDATCHFTSACRGAAQGCPFQNEPVRLGRGSRTAPTHIRTQVTHFTQRPRVAELRSPVREGTHDRAQRPAGGRGILSLATERGRKWRWTVTPKFAVRDNKLLKIESMPYEGQLNQTMPPRAKTVRDGS